MFLSKHQRLGCYTLLVLSMNTLLVVPSFARKAQTNSPFTPEMQIQLDKAGRYARSGNTQKAKPIMEATINAADDVQKCLAIASLTESYGYQYIDVKRLCLSKAFSLCKNQQDYFLVALKARQCEIFEVTKQCIERLIQDAKTIPELFDLANKSQQIALNDVAHLAMEKAYTGVKTVPEALLFAHQMRMMGMEDLVRKVIKDLIDDEDKSSQLCTILKGVEDLGVEDLNRYCLKKALDKAQNIDDLKCIYEGARRNQQNDIMSVALYRGRRLTIIQKIQHDQAEYQQQLKQWQESSRESLARQQAEAEADLNSSEKRFGSSGSTKTPNDSGF